MKTKEIAHAVISLEDKTSLEKAWYYYKAINELLNQSGTNEVLIGKFQEAYEAYNKCWGYILRTYFETDYTSGNYSWNCDFYTNTVTVTQNK